MSLPPPLRRQQKVCQNRQVLPRACCRLRSRCAVHMHFPMPSGLGRMGFISAPRALFQPEELVDCHQYTEHSHRSQHPPPPCAIGMAAAALHGTEDWLDRRFHALHIASHLAQITLFRVLSSQLTTNFAMTRASIISILRLGANAPTHSRDPTWEYVPVMIWSTVEGNVGVVCACCPVLAPVVRRCFCRTANPTPGHRRGPPLSTIGCWPGRRARRDQSFSRLEEDTTNLVNASAGNSVRVENPPGPGSPDGSAVELDAV